MSYAPLTCPYCNAYVQVPSAGSLALDQRLVCPRCGEMFTPLPNSYAGQDAPTGPSFEAVAGDTPVSPREKPRGRNRLVAAILLAGMAVMAGISLAFALRTTDLRRAHDTGGSQSNSRLPIPTEPITLPATGPVAPAKLDALAWLPPDTSLIVGIHLSEIGDSKAGEALLRQSIVLGGVHVKIDDLVSWTGMERSNVDHLVVGLKIEDTPPRMTLVLHTKQRYDADALRAKLKATRLPDANGHRLDVFSTPNPDVKPVVWCADDHTLVYGLVPFDVKDAPLKPERDLWQLPTEIRVILQQRVESVGPLWIAGTAKDWSKSVLVQLLFQNMKPENRARLNRVRTFAAWVELDATVTVKGAFDCRDDAGAKGVEEYFQRLRKEDNPELKLAREDGWVTLQWRTKVDAIQKALEK